MVMTVPLGSVPLIWMNAPAPEGPPHILPNSPLDEETVLTDPDAPPAPTNPAMYFALGEL
jgi:hypothetical protein